MLLSMITTFLCCSLGQYIHEPRVFKLAEYLRGWMGYFVISELYQPTPEFDHWLRRRVRMCYWKQWRYCRTKVRELTKLGTFLRTAILVGLSRKGPWRLSRTLATQSGMTNQWLKNQGLLSIKDLWVHIHYPATVNGNEKMYQLWRSKSLPPC